MNVQWSQCKKKLQQYKWGNCGCGWAHVHPYHLVQSILCVAAEHDAFAFSLHLKKKKKSLFSFSITQAGNIFPYLTKTWQAVHLIRACPCSPHHPRVHSVSCYCTQAQILQSSCSNQQGLQKSASPARKCWAVMLKQEGRILWLMVHPSSSSFVQWTPHLMTRNVYMPHMLIVFIFESFWINFHIKSRRSKSVDFHTHFMLVVLTVCVLSVWAWRSLLPSDTCLLLPVSLHTCSPFTNEAPAVYSVTWRFPQVFARPSVALALLGNNVFLNII